MRSLSFAKQAVIENTPKRDLVFFFLTEEAGVKSVREADAKASLESLKSRVSDHMLANDGEIDRETAVDYIREGLQLRFEMENSRGLITGFVEDSFQTYSAYGDPYFVSQKAAFVYNYQGMLLDKLDEGQPLNCVIQGISTLAS